MTEGQPIGPISDPRIVRVDILEAELHGQDPERETGVTSWRTSVAETEKNGKQPHLGQERKRGDSTHKQPHDERSDSDPETACRNNRSHRLANVQDEPRPLGA